jgi:hypothetical protein
MGDDDLVSTMAEYKNVFQMSQLIVRTSTSVANVTPYHYSVSLSARSRVCVRTFCVKPHTNATMDLSCIDDTLVLLKLVTVLLLHPCLSSH